MKKLYECDIIVFQKMLQWSVQMNNRTATSVVIFDQTAICWQIIVSRAQFIVYNLFYFGLYYSWV